MCSAGRLAGARRRASTTRRTSTVPVSEIAVDGRTVVGPWVLTGKRLLDIDHVPRTRLHEAAPPLSRPLEALLRGDLSLALEVALVACDNPDRRDPGIVHAVFLLHVDHLHEEVERVERGRLGDVVDEQEGIGLQVRGCPEAAVFLLAGGVGEHEMVRLAVYAARDRVRVFDGGVISASATRSAASAHRGLDRWVVRGPTRTSTGSSPAAG